MKKQLPMEGPWTEKEAVHQKLGVEAIVSRRWREELPADPPLEPWVLPITDSAVELQAGLRWSQETTREHHKLQGKGPEFTP